MALVSLSEVKVLRLNRNLFVCAQPSNLSLQHIPTATSKRILPEVGVCTSAVYGIAEELKSPRRPEGWCTPVASVLGGGGRRIGSVGTSSDDM